MKLKIKREPGELQLEIKRFYLPGVVLTSTCPECGEKVTMDLGEDYLSYPKVGAPETVSFNHEYWDKGNCEDHEWEEEIIIGIKVKRAGPS